MRDLLVSCVSLTDTGDGSVLVSNVRHYEALTRALAAIRRVQSGLATQLSTDLVAQDLRDCLCALADINSGVLDLSAMNSDDFEKKVASMGHRVDTSIDKLPSGFEVGVNQKK